MKVAVLTGDLVGSTRANAASVDSAFVCLKQTAEDIAGWTGEPTHFTRYRGDGWQMVIKRPEMALRAALFIHVSNNMDDRAMPSRISIGLGQAEHLGTQDLSDARGSAFVHSGQGLDNMARAQRLCVAGEGITPLHIAIVELIDERSRKWSREQSEAMQQALEPTNYSLEFMAIPLNITPQAVAYRLQAAGANAIRSALEKWETTP
jgi:hypothetical protein